MFYKDIYTELDYTDLVDVKKKCSSLELDEFHNIGIDKVYFSGNFPAIFFKEVKQFDEVTLKEISKILHLAWNYRKVTFLSVLSTSEIRIYNCSKKPFNYESKDVDLKQELKGFEIVSETVNALKIIKEIFSRIAVDSGTLWITDNPLRKKIDIQQRVDRFLIKSLLSAAKELRRTGLEDNIIHSLLLRSIFIMYLEDKGAAQETTLYSEIKEDAKSYLDILEDKNATFTLFNKLENHFNGNVFPLVKDEQRKVTKNHLKIIRKCLIDGDLSDNPKLFENWKLFKFDIIQIELLSEIYENFLTEFRTSKKDEKGQYYTPPSLVELILNEKLQSVNEKNWNFKILDPACGSGIFLVESFKRLVKRWKNEHPNQKIEFNHLVEILRTNIFGIEYNKFAIRVATFSLYLAIVEQLNPRTLWIDKSRKFPCLIRDKEDNSLEKQGKNLFRADTIGEVSFEDIPQVDLVVGNPPFGANIKQKSIKDYCKKNGFGQDLVIPFLHKSIEFAKNGSVALIFNTKVLTNTEQPFQNFRKWLFNDTYVEKIYNLSIFRKTPKSFGGQLFTSAVGPVSIAFYQRNAPKPFESTIEYWAPKTYVKNSLIEGVLIDSSDIKFLPREECQKPDTKIWKIAMWGSMEDFKLIEYMSEKYLSLRKYFTSKFDLNYGVGLELSTPKNKFNNKIKSLPHHKPDTILPYYTDKSHSITIKDNYFRRLGKLKAYKAPHVLIKEGVTKGKIISAFLDYDSSYYKGIIGVYSKSRNSQGLKVLNTYLNSDIVRYLSFLTTSSWGIERDVIKYKELFSLPYLLSSNYRSEEKLVKILDKAISELKSFLIRDTSVIDKYINKILNKQLEYRANILIKDLLQFNLDLFQRGHNSIALKATSLPENETYAILLCKELNEFLSSKLRIKTTIFDFKRYNPLNMVILKIGNFDTSITKLNIETFHKYLREIDKYLLKQEAKNIYIKKQLKYFDKDLIYIIKPNQKRFWSRSAALNDAQELINEILKM